VIAVPPLAAGAVHVSDTWPAPRVGVTPVGAPGTTFGVTEFDAADDPLEWKQLSLATTLNVYGVPFVRPVMLREVAIPGAVAVTSWLPVAGTEVTR
jgi:hypothetical protein